MEAFDQVKQALKDLSAESNLPKNFRAKLNTTVAFLNNENEDISLRINKALHALDEMTDESNIEAFTRTQIWNIVSMLEMISTQL